MAHTLTVDQEKALTGILEFIQKPVKELKDCATILYAAAGCGKTFLTRVIVDKVRGKYSIAGVAPTHKARKVLDQFLNQNSFYTIKTMTIASLLSKLRTEETSENWQFQSDAERFSIRREIPKNHF